MKTYSDTFAPGALVDWQLKELIKKGYIQAKADCVQPASIDLSLHTSITQLSASTSLPKEGFDPTECISRFGINHFPLNHEPVTLTPGNVYIAPVTERIDLPPGITGYCNPKSSTGRTDITVSLIRAGEHRHNTLTKEGRGRMYLLIQTRSFSVQVSPGIRLAQVRLFKGARQCLTHNDYFRFQSQSGLVAGTKPIFEDAGLVLHLNLKGGNLVSNSCQAPIDLRERNARLKKYFHRREVVEGLHGQPTIFLEAGQFLLATTKELVSIPPGLSAVMAPYREDFGQLVTHYAGFFDPGFGYRLGVPLTTTASTVVCEIRNISGAPMALTDGQSLATLQYEHNSSTPRGLYEGNYQGQRRVTPAKYFSYS